MEYHGVSTVAVAPSSSSAVQLRRLCRHILGPTVQDEILSSHFRNALQLLSTSASGQLQPTVDEFVIAEKIKKYLVQDGRENEVSIFTEIQTKLQKSGIIKNRCSILALLLNLSEKRNKAVPTRRPPFPVGSLPLKSDEGSQNEPQSSAYLARVVPVPYRNSRPIVNGSSPSTPTAVDGRSKSPSSYHPPLPPKPNLSKSPRSGATLTQLGVQPNAAERELLRELVYTFQGIEGVIVRRDPHSTDEAPSFTINQIQKDRFQPPVIHLALRLAEIGWLYNVVHHYCVKETTEKEIGLISQSFVTALKDELSDFYKLLTHLENEFLKTDSAQGLSLHQLAVYTLEPLSRLKLLASVVQTCGKLRGGALISGLYGFLHHGDNKMSSTVEKLLTTVCKPLYHMISRWILDGNLEDPYAEFFIASDSRVQDESRLWHDKYSIRKAMIPKFLGLAWVKKILATGKGINFLSSVCKNSVPIPGKEAIKKTLLKDTSPKNLFTDRTGNQYLDVLGRCYKETSNLVLDVLFNKYKLLDHVTAMRKYLLLGQGDLIRFLLELLDPELGQPATQLYPHNLAGILETAIRATNTQFEDPDILERLDVRLLDIQPGDTGWDVFSLDYKCQGPIGTIFGQRTITHYLMLFNALWRSKRMEWILSCVWTRQTGMHKMAMRSLPELRPVLHLANLLSSEMVHFVHQLSYYHAFEVMECSWDQLVRQLKQAENLDEVIEAHEEFLQTLIRRGLLDDRSRDILTQLRAIYDRIIEFSNIQNQLYAASAAESESRNSFELEVRARERRREYGLTQEEEDDELLRREEFARTTLPQLETQLKIVCQSYQDMVKTFLLQLACCQDQSLQFLSFRLDFNEHYKKKDVRLGTSFTLQHKRPSILD